MLDIIIPTYKNKEALVRSLESIPNYQELNVTVVDDCSGLDYTDLQEKYNFRLIELQQNVGPGVAREIGIVSTHEPYILFLDTGDYFIEGALSEVLGIINIHPNICIFSWRYEIGDANYDINNNNLHGRVYKREFLDKFNIYFSEAGSYANEDVGFNHACRLIMFQYYPNNDSVLTLNKSIIVYDTNDMTSITRRDNRAFIYKDQNMGLALNAIHAYNIAKANNVDDSILKDYLSDIMGSQYFFFLRTLEERPEYLQIAWDGARYFYFNCFKQIFTGDDYTISYRRMLLFYKNAYQTKPKIRFNAKLFIRLLEANEQVPPYYTTLAENIDTIGGEQVE